MHYVAIFASNVATIATNVKFTDSGSGTFRSSILVLFDHFYWIYRMRTAGEHGLIENHNSRPPRVICPPGRLVQQS